jgi:hypothetical protein
MGLHILSETTYSWDGETLAVQQFGPCTTHAPAHAWKYVKKDGGQKMIVECQGPPDGCACAEYDAI